MMALVQRVWLFIILYTGYDVYLKFEEHQTEMKTIEDTKSGIRNRIKKNKKKVQELEKFFSDIKEAEGRMKKVEEQAKVLQLKFPSVINDSEYLGFFNGVASSLNMKNIRTGIVGEENKGFYFIKTYEVNTSATYLQTLMFLEKISEDVRLINILAIKFEQLKLKQRSRHKLLNTTFRIMAYRYNKNYQEEIERKQKEEERKNKKNKKNKKRSKKKKGKR